MSKRRKNRRNRPAMKAECVRSLADLASVHDLATDHGITVNVSEVLCSQRFGTKTLHWTFNADRAQVLAWWPGNGTVWSKATGYKGKAADAYAALDLAAKLASEYQEAQLTDEERHLRSIMARVD